MKKVLALVLALAMILGCFSFVSAAEFSDVTAEADYHDAAVVLSDLGVASGYSDGTFKPAQVVTRAEMAAFIIKALGITPSSSATTTFSDVPASHWASGYIAYATSLGVVSGYTDGTFKPDQTVSYDQAITMLVQALGYTADALTGTYPAAYVNKAKALGILDDVSALGTAGANRGDIAQLVYNTLACPIGTVDKDGQWGASLISTAPVVYDSMFNRLGVDTSYPFEGVITAEEIEDAVIDISDYFGAYVTAYENDDDEIVAITSLVSTFVDDEVGIDDDGKYYVGDYTLKAAAEADFVVEFVNGEKVDSYALITDLLEAFDEDDAVVAVETSGNYVTDVYAIQFWTGAQFIMVDDTDLSDLEDGELDGAEFVLTDDDEIDYTAFVLQGVASLDEIEEDDIVKYYTNSDNEITKLTVGKEVVTGKITKSTSSKVTIDGTAYKFTNTKIGTAKTQDDFNFTTVYELYLDYAGTVRYITTASSDDSYAVLIDVKSSSSSWASDDTSDLQVKLFTVDGKTEIFETEDDSVDDFADLLVDASGVIDTNLNRVVKYSVDTDGEIDGLELVTGYVSVTDKTISSTGLLNGKYLADDAIICIQSGNATDGFEYAIKTKSEVKGLDIATADYVVDSDSEIEYAFITLDDSDSVYAVYEGGLTKISSTKATASFIIDGESTSKDTKVSYAVAANGFSVDWRLAEITLDTDGYVEKVEAYTTAAGADKVVEVELTSASSLSINNNTLIIDDEDYAIAEDALVYLIDAQDDEEFDGLGKLSNLKKAESGDSIYLYSVDVIDSDDTDDFEGYDIVIWLY